MPQILYPQWRDEHEAVHYPFADGATLSNGSQRFLEGSFLDAILYPVGGGARLYLAAVIVDVESVTFVIGDESNSALARGAVSLLRPAAQVALVDDWGRPAGLLLSTPERLSLFSAWGSGTWSFTIEQTPFAADVCVPTPAVGVRGLLLDDGTVLSGEVWLVGEDGVVLSATAARDASRQTVSAIRVDVVGDPLFRRRLCGSQDLFDTPRFLRTLTVVDAQQSVVLRPDDWGNVRLSVNNADAADTVLRLRTTPGGIILEAAGSPITE